MSDEDTKINDVKENTSTDVSKTVRRKKGKIFSTKDSMLAILDQVAGKQDLKVKEKLDKQVGRNQHFEEKKKRKADRQLLKKEEVEHMKQVLKKKPKLEKKARELEAAEKAKKEKEEAKEIKKPKKKVSFV